MQIMGAHEAPNYRFNPFDVTKVWPHRDYPLMTVGRVVLDRNPENYFAEVEQAAFDPASFVPGIGPSPDKMLQGRLFSYGDAQRYRLGANHLQLPVNLRAPPKFATTAATARCVSTVTMDVKRITSQIALADRNKVTNRCGRRQSCAG